MRQRITVELPLSNQIYAVDIIEIHELPQQLVAIASIGKVETPPLIVKPTISDGITIFTNADQPFPVKYYVIITDEALRTSLAHNVGHLTFIRDKNETTESLNYHTRVFLGGTYHLPFFAPNSLIPLAEEPDNVQSEDLHKQQPR